MTFLEEEAITVSSSMSGPVSAPGAPALEIRELTQADVEEWADLLRRVNATDPRVVAWAPEVLHTRFSNDFGVDGPSSLAGAWLDGALIGYARVRQDGGAESRLLRLAGTVDPAVRRQGIGTRLLRWSMGTVYKWTRVLGPIDVIVDAAAAEEDLRAILEQLSFREASTFAEMSRTVSADTIPTATRGLVVVPFRAEEHEAAALDVHRSARGEGADSEFLTVLAKQTFRPELSRVALDPDSGAVIGYLLVVHAPGDTQGWVDAIGVRRSERGRDVTAQLIVSALVGLCEDGLTSAGMGFMIDATAEQDLAVCASLGFEMTLSWTRFVRSVEPQVESAVSISVTPVAELSGAELDDVAAWVAPRNGPRQTYVGYLGTYAPQVRAELDALSPGAVVAQLHYGGHRMAMMIGEWDPESSRAWLHGPWAAADEVADAVFAALEPYLPAAKNEWEVFCDRSNRMVTGFAERHGLLPDGAFDILQVARGGQLPTPVNTVTRYDEAHFAAFEKLHYNAHPDTHLTAERIVTEGVPLWLGFYDGEVRGYITIRRSAGESIARIEHMSTAPSLAEGARTQLKTDLLASALSQIFDEPEINQVEITTRTVTSDPAAAAVGFQLIRQMGLYRTVPRLTTHVSSD
ncbi:GNAT family N-acetyltransferase [Nocardioides sp. 1609]|uniref:GNAT family N-acetyltransferase n=1 Tax=Nocardioides sp. 1609 TaxID=2508327 RepID=UPI00106F241C|nr:GNAT family N-acetyltransferase [Nocardioides sp. 1609]